MGPFIVPEFKHTDKEKNIEDHPDPEDGLFEGCFGDVESVDDFPGEIDGEDEEGRAVGAVFEGLESGEDVA